ncbi:PREDICTED: protein rough sheath 2 homolog [Fragaria vesca subsp. vesca]|uniref:protein rough sheath 2 homolog n=1 Tax=Fragaria vesca subsp. vesca TaxID=101020 RepID=UPI0002C31867|nr:PREDICTED: protein rough sheath 2 homolog [Fragaria vesca subsp. vesca]
MKERQRWQPEEDALLRAYVKQYGPREWALVSQRMGQPINRDPKSCLERWKNYLRPGLKKGSLSPEEQSLVIELQAKYGNKWKKIAAELPGRTPKRLGKWWEVFRDKQLKHLSKLHPSAAAGTAASSSSSTPPEGNIPISSPERAAQGPYDHILETFAEKYVQPKLYTLTVEPDPNISLGSGLPPWMNPPSATTSTSSSATASPSVSLSLSPSDPGHDPDPTRVGMIVQWCKEVEEGRQSWVQHKKEATWRLSRLEQQLEAEKARKRREAVEEVEAKIRALREEEAAFMGRIESECREQMSVLQREAESKEAKLVEAWCSKHVRLAKLVDRIGSWPSFSY